MKQRIGILGGMGPAATIDLMQKILAATPAQRDQDHVPLVVWSVPQMPERVSAILSGTSSPLPQLVAGAQALERSGAAALAIACNTAHHWADALSERISIPVLHIADAVITHLGRRAAPVRTVALLATAATLHSGFYQARFAAQGIATLVPAALDQAQGVTTAIQFVKAGRIEAARALFLPVARRMLDAGADSLLLGCTELPLLTPGSGFEAQCLDATSALAHACIAFAMRGEALTNPTEPRLGDQMARGLS